MFEFPHRPGAPSRCRAPRCGCPQRAAPLSGTLLWGMLAGMSVVQSATLAPKRAVHPPSSSWMNFVAKTGVVDRTLADAGGRRGLVFPHDGSTSWGR